MTGHLGDPARVLENVKMLSIAAAKSDKPYYLMSSRPGTMNTQQVKALREAGLVQIGGTRQGLGALDRVGRYMAPRPPVRVASRPCAGEPWRTLLAANPARRTINEFDAKRLLGAYGVRVTREQCVSNPAEATDAAREIGFPVVLKVVSDDIPHKTELGLVAVNLQSEQDARASVCNAVAAARPDQSRPSDCRYLVQEFVAGGVEVFAGVSRDPDFGLSLAFGMGGTAIEVTRDFALRMLPLREGDAEAMIAETRAAALLGAVRGKPAADVASLATCLYALADFACANADRPRRDRPQPDQGAAGGTGLHRGGCLDRGPSPEDEPWDI